MKDRRRAGFTLIEMLIVITVIAILLGVLLPQFRGAQDEAATQRAKSELRTLATAVESYYIHNSNTIASALTSLTTATPRIVSSIPDDPFRAGSNDYSYYRDTNAVYYVIFSYGPDRTAGVTGISTAGALTGTVGDDVCATNGNGNGGSSC